MLGLVLKLLPMFMLPPLGYKKYTFFFFTRMLLNLNHSVCGPPTFIGIFSNNWTCSAQKHLSIRKTIIKLLIHTLQLEHLIWKQHILKMLLHIVWWNTFSGGQSHKLLGNDLMLSYQDSMVILVVRTQAPNTWGEIFPGVSSLRKCQHFIYAPGTATSRTRCLV